MTQQFNLIGIIQILYRWRKMILGLCFLAGILSIGLSLLKKNYYKAYTSFYIAHQDLFKPEKLFGTSTGNMYYYGSSEDVDRILSIAQSENLKLHLINKYNLFEHYDIDKDGKNADKMIRKAFNKLYTVQKTKYDAVEISIEDVDKELATQMTNESRIKLDALATSIIKDRQSKMIQTFDENIKRKKKDIKILTDSISLLRDKYGVFESGAAGAGLSSLAASVESSLSRQTARYNALKKSPSIPQDTLVMIQATIQGLQTELNNLIGADSKSKFNLNKFNQGKGQIDGLVEQFVAINEQLGLDITRLEQYEATLKSNTSSLHLIEAAQVPVEKSRPKRSIIVLASVFAAFIFSVLAALFLESTKNINWKEILNE